MDQVQLKYQTSKTVTLDVLAIHGLSEPDHLVKFPGIVHEFLDGSLAEQIAGSRRNGTIDFQVMTDLNVRKAVDWWNDPDRIVVCLIAAPGKPSKSGSASGTLNGDFLYKISAVDMVGESACGTVSDTISLAVEGCPLIWTASTGARKYKIYRSVDAGATWALVDYSRTNSYTDTGATPYLTGVTPPSSASQISIITDGDFELKWMYDTELARMLSVPFREASIFLRTNPFPV